MPDLTTAIISTRWIGAGTLGAFALWVVAFNAYVIGCHILQRPRPPSPVFVVGGMMATFALISAPVNKSIHLIWIPIALEAGVPVILAVVECGRILIAKIFNTDR